MKNQNVENALQYEFYDRNAGEKFIKMAKDGLVSAFIYSRNVLSLGEVKRYDDERSSVRTVAKGGEVFVPTLFSCFFFINPIGNREIFLFFYYPADEFIAYLMTVEELDFYDEIECDDLFAGNDPRERIMIFQLPDYESEP